jgi:predicted nucleic acid-binding Zn ribbon protein
MERAVRLIKKNKFSRQIINDDDIVRGLWPTAVGKAVARHTGKMTMVRNTLVVEVEDAIWQKQLFCLSRQILDRVQKLMGSTSIQEIEFRTGIPRRQPQRAESLHPFGAETLNNSGDGAAGIQDAVLKKVYRLSRKRATA